MLGLLDAGADPNIIEFGSLYGNTSEGAEKREKHDIARILITNRKYNYRVNDSSSKPWPPIMSAITWGNVTYVQYLLMKHVGTNIDFKDNVGKSPMDRALDLEEGTEKYDIINLLTAYENRN